MEAITSRKRFEEVKQLIEEIIKQGDEVGGVDNLPEKSLNLLGSLLNLTGDYESNVLKLDTLKGRSIVIIRIEEEMFNRRMTQKEFSKFLGISETQLSDVINMKILISMNLTMKFHELLDIDANLIVEHNKQLKKNKPETTSTRRKIKPKEKIRVKA